MDKMAYPICCYLLLLLVSRVCLATSTHIRILAGSETEMLHSFSAEDDSLPFLLGGAALQEQRPRQQDESLFTGTTQKDLLSLDNLDNRNNLAFAAQAPTYYPTVYGHHASSSAPSPSPSYLQSYSPSVSPSPSYSAPSAPPPPLLPSSLSPSAAPAPLPSMPLPPTPYENVSLPSTAPAIIKDDIASQPPTAFIPVSVVPGASNAPPPLSDVKDHGPPYCSATVSTCLSVNATVGTILDAFLLSVAGWKSSSLSFPSLVYEFGVLAISAGSGTTVRRMRQLYSDATVATMAGLPAGNTSLYVCVRSATRTITGMDAVGPRTCTTLVVQISAQVSFAQLASELSAIEGVLSSLSSNASTSSVHAIAQRLAAVAAFASGTFAAPTRSLASELLLRLVALSVRDPSSGSSVLIMAFDGLNTLWSIANAQSCVSVLAGINVLSAKLASQPLAAEDVQPVADFFESMIAGAMDVITSVSLELRAQDASDMLTSVLNGADSITRGLLNSAVCNGNTVQFATSRLSAAAQCLTTVLATANSLTVSLARPGSSAAGRRSNRVLLTLSPATVTLHPAAIGPLCTAEDACASMGLRFTVTTLTDTSLLIMALGGYAVSLASNLPGYRVGGSVEIVSPILRLAAQNLPFPTSNLFNLVTFDILINMTAIMARSSGTSTRLAVIRLQDSGAAAIDPSLGIFPGPSTTGTTQSDAVRGIVDAISGYSNSLGDFVVLQYESIAVQNAASASPSRPDDASTGVSNAGQVRKHLLLLTIASVVCVMLAPN
ncbi:hypothetical protein Vafri_15721 [Volvox africanus]|nr:hypothetical protein Vafri_15721 [Volvox africanus]